MTERTDPPEDPSLTDVFDQLDELEDTVDTEAELKEVADVRQTLERLPGGEFVGERIERYTTRDVAESFVGSILLSLPLLVEDGVFTIADHFLSETVAGVPVWLAANVGFIVVLVWGLLYWADFRELKDSRPIFGLVPRRLVGVLVISFVTAALTMTMWGRVAWSEPAVAVARVSVVWSPAAFGAVLGDTLPGESGGTDINDIPSTIGTRVADRSDSESES